MKFPHTGLDEVWRQNSIPQWQRILQASIERGDKKREEYAQRMLTETLKPQQGGTDE